MKLSLRTKLVAVLVVAPVLLLLVAIGVIWTLDYRQRVAEQGGMFRSESIQVSRSLRLAVERSIGSLNDLLSLGGVAALLESEEDPRLDLSSEAWKVRMRQIDSVWSSLRLDSPQVQIRAQQSARCEITRFRTQKLDLCGDHCRGSRRQVGFGNVATVEL